MSGGFDIGVALDLCELRSSSVESAGQKSSSVRRPIPLLQITADRAGPPPPGGRSLLPRFFSGFPVYMRGRVRCLLPSFRGCSAPGKLSACTRSTARLSWDSAAVGPGCTGIAEGRPSTWATRCPARTLASSGNRSRMVSTHSHPRGGQPLRRFLSIRSRRLIDCPGPHDGVISNGRRSSSASIIEETRRALDSPSAGGACSMV